MLRMANKEVVNDFRTNLPTSSPTFSADYQTCAVHLLVGIDFDNHRLVSIKAGFV